MLDGGVVVVVERGGNGTGTLRSDLKSCARRRNGLVETGGGPTSAIVSVMLANNEVGTIQPIAELAAAAHARGALFHTDAVQAAGKIPIDVGALGVDLLSISGHKFNGPKGAGALWIRRGTRLVSQMTGGRQEKNRRAGTENVPALAGLGVAAERARAKLADMPRVAEPFFMGLNAKVEYAPAMNAEDLKKGLSRLG